MTQFISCLKSCLVVQYPIMLKTMTDEEIKEYHLKKLYQLSLKSLGQVSRLKNLDGEQIEKVRRRMDVLNEVGEFGTDNDI